MVTWLESFFQNAFAAVGPLGLLGFALLVIVAIVAIIAGVRGSQLITGIVGTVALLGVVVIATLNQIYPSKTPQPIPADKAPPAAAPAGSNARWFDTGLQADWGGKDTFYGGGERPVYEANGRTLCDDGLLGRVATCWGARVANNKSMADGVPTNIDKTAGRRDWCAYKDDSVTLATRQDGGAELGRVYACAHSISR
jgi:hypothetical protein